MLSFSGRSVVLDNETRDSIMEVYKRGWVDGANASTAASNSMIEFNAELARVRFQLDSMKVALVIWNLKKEDEN